MRKKRKLFLQMIAYCFMLLSSLTVWAASDNTCKLQVMLAGFPNFSGATATLSLFDENCHNFYTNSQLPIGSNFAVNFPNCTVTIYIKATLKDDDIRWYQSLKAFNTNNGAYNQITVVQAPDLMLLDEKPKACK